jgi:hypothetical protein
MIIVEKHYPMVWHKWISLFIWYPVFVFDYVYESKDWEFYMKLTKKIYKKIIWNKGTLMINNIPAWLLFNIPFIIYLLIK